MNAVSFDTDDLDFDADAPLTERAPAISIARLIARTRDDDTVSRTPSIDLIAISNGADGAAVERMRNLYASGDAEQALAVAATLAPATLPVSSAVPSDPLDGLVVVEDALDLAIREIDLACSEQDLDIDSFFDEPDVVDLDAIFQSDVVQVDEPFAGELADIEELDSDFLELDPS